MHEVYAYGVIAPSLLIECADPYPGAGGYAEITAVHESLGGEAAASAYVLSRLGIATKLAGNHLHDDPATAAAVDLLEAAGVDCSAVTIEPGTAPLRELVIATGADRTVFGTYRDLLERAAWSQPSRDDIRVSRMVCLDPFLSDASETAARWCVEDGIPFVTIDTPPNSLAATQAAATVVSEEYANRTMAGTKPLVVLAEYTSRGSGLAIITQGSGDVVFSRPGAAPRSVASFPVYARDTTGAGDAFRAGIVYGLMRGLDDETLIRTAAGVAALVCLTAPGVVHSPTEPELDEFLADLS